MASLNRLQNIENLVKNLAGKLDALIGERAAMHAEIACLRRRLMERDEEAVKALRDAHTDLECAQAHVMRLEYDRRQSESKLSRLNEKLIAMAEGRRGG